MAARVKVEYFIYKNFKGMPYPGQEWDGPFDSMKSATSRFNKYYYDTPNNKGVFNIVKVTLQRQPIPKT